MTAFSVRDIANRMKHPLPVHPEHLCVLRLSALGDVCNLVPTVRALQRQWPGVRITWIIGKGEHSLLAGLSGVEFVVYDKASGLAGMRAIWQQLRDTRFDALLHMQQAVRASLLSLGLKARVRIGYLPELFRYQPFLSAREVLHLHTALAGMPPERRRSAVDHVSFEMASPGC